MAKGKLTSALQHLRRMIGAGSAAAESDGRLLEQFLYQQDEAAFAEVVRRHGPMVLAVCRRVLRDGHDAEDAFQATFLVLAKKANSIRNQQSVAGWLARVAHNLALAARLKAARRLSREREAMTMARAEPEPDLDRLEMRTLLDDELHRLPAKLHAPVVLCYLEGKTYEEAAQVLQWPLGTVKKRLGQARDRLRTRLAQRGMAVSAVVVGTLLEEHAPAAVPGLLLETTVRAALHVAAGRTIMAAGSAQAAALAEGMVKSMLALKIKLAVVCLLAATVIAVTSGVVAVRALDRPSTAADAAVAVAANVEQPRVDKLNDPLPAGAIARMGTVRFRHDANVTGVVYAPDGKTLAAAAPGDKKLRIWNAATGHEVRSIDLPDGVVRAAFDREGRFIAVHTQPQRQGIDQDEIAVCDVATGQVISRVPAHGAEVTCFALSGDGRVLATAGGSMWDLNRDGERARRPGEENEETIRLWTVATGKPIAQLTQARNIHVLAFSSDSRMLASAHADGVRVWEVASGKERYHLSKDCAFVNSLAFAPDGNGLAAGTGRMDRGNVVPEATVLWNLATGQGRTIRRSCSSLAFSPDSKTLGGVANGARLWNATTGEELRVLGGERSGVASIAFAPDGKTAAVASCHAIELWDCATGPNLLPLPGHEAEITRFAWSPDGRTMASASPDATIRLWDAATYSERLVLRGNFERVYSLTFSPDGRTLAATVDNRPRSFPGSVLLWDVASGKLVNSLSGQRNFFFHAQFSPDGRIIAANELSEYLSLWDAASGKKLRDFSGGDYFCFSPDAKLIAFQGTGHSARRNARTTIHICEVASGNELHRFENAEGFWNLVFSPNGKSVAAVQGDGLAIFVWDTLSGKPLQRYVVAGNVPLIRFLGFPPSGRVRVGEGANGFVRLWEGGTDREVRCFVNQYLAGRMSPDGRFLLRPNYSLGNTGIVDLTTDQERRRLTGIGVTAFSPDGYALVTGGRDSALVVWDMGDLYR